MKTTEVIVPESPTGKFLMGFPPGIVAILIGLLILALNIFVPDTPVVLMGMDTNLRVVLTTVIIPVILTAARSLGVNMSVLYEVVQLGGGGALPPAAAGAAPRPATALTVSPTQGKKWNELIL